MLKIALIVAMGKNVAASRLRRCEATAMS
jgi:hypothetical protein